MDVLYFGVSGVCVGDVGDVAEVGVSRVSDMPVGVE